MRQCNPQDIHTPIFRTQLKTALHHHELRVMKRKVFVYRTAAIAAMLLFCISIAVFTTKRDRINVNDTYKRIAESIESTNSINNEELEKVITEESIKTGTPVYPTEVTHMMVKKIRLNNGKEIIVQSEMDNQHYAIAF